jgi:hypothetical protein
MKELAGLKNLSILALNSSKVTDVGLRELERLHNLTQLYLHGTRVTNDGFAALRESLPKCMIFR